MAHNNHAVTGIRTVYVPCSPALGYISSRFVREIARVRWRRIEHLVAPFVAEALARRYAHSPPRRRDVMSHDDRYSDGYDDDYEEIDDEYPEAARAGRVRR